MLGAWCVCVSHGKWALALVLAVHLQIFFENDVRLPEALFEEVDEGLTEVLPRRLTVQEVTFIWIDLDNHRARSHMINTHIAITFRLQPSKLA